MIDETNLKIEEMTAAIQRDNDRRHAFYRVLQATDRVLWKLEELNRDGIKHLEPGQIGQMKESLSVVPVRARQAFRDTQVVQEALDSLFEVQEALFKWRNPELAFDDADDLEQAG